MNDNLVGSSPAAVINTNNLSIKTNEIDLTFEVVIGQTVLSCNAPNECISDCPLGNVGDSCDDGDSGTMNDQLQNDCSCS